MVRGLKEVTILGTLLFVLITVLVMAVFLGAGGYGVRRYWSLEDSEVVSSPTTGMGAAAGIAMAVLALLVLVLLFFGLTQWSWFTS